MMESKVKVGLFIQLPTVNNLKPTKKRTKQVVRPSKSIFKKESNKLNISSQSSFKFNSSKLNSSESKPTTSTKSCQSNQDRNIDNQSNKLIKLTDEDKERQLNEFVDKIKSVFNRKLIELKYKKQIINECVEKEICSILPPFEFFVKMNSEDNWIDLRREKFLNYLIEDDYLIGHLIKITNSFKSDIKRAYFKLICFDGCKRRLIHDLNLTACYLIDEECTVINDLISEYCDIKYFRFKLHKVIKEQIFVTFKHSTTSMDDNLHLNLGLIDYDELPEHFKKVVHFTKQTNANEEDKSIENFNDLLHSNKQFKNPTSIDYLLETLQIDNEKRFFNYKQLIHDSSLEINQSRINDDLKLGIECLKNGKYDEAESFLNKVIDIDSNNVDAIVAKGCLLANQSKLKEASDKFEFALKLDNKHVNARIYLIETLIAYGEKLYKEKNYIESLNRYKKVLNYDKENEKAINAIQKIEFKFIDQDDDRKNKRSRSSSDKSFKRRYY